MNVSSAAVAVRPRLPRTPRAGTSCEIDVGGTGYTGVELLRLLAEHPEVDVRAITSRKDAGTKVADMFASLRGKYALTFVEPAAAQLDKCDVVFFATPHGVAMVNFQPRCVPPRA